jgi:hypothetical protein
MTLDTFPICRRTLTPVTKKGAAASVLEPEPGGTSTWVF